MTDNPNPQGKGQVPVLATLAETRAGAAEVPAKNVERVSTELFTSLFVLESDFQFKPVRGKAYWLYRKEGRFWLSMLSPEELGASIYGAYIGKAQLQPDMTWTLELSDEAAEDQAFLDYLAQKRAELEERLENAETVDDAMPNYEGGLGFYQRAFAFALANSLGTSMEYAGISGLTYEQAKGQIGHEGSGDD
jgi:hypothetical protein